MDNLNPEKFETNGPDQSGAESRETNREAGAEKREQVDYQGASLLEEPKNGSFLSALQLFAAWVKSVVADDEKDVL